jgi:hypothetical protein
VPEVYNLAKQFPSRQSRTLSVLCVFAVRLPLAIATPLVCLTTVLLHKPKFGIADVLIFDLTHPSLFIMMIFRENLI